MSSALSEADKSYRRLNLTVLVVLAYLVVTPLAALYVSRWTSGAVLLCASVRFLGRPCPLCGWTRGLDALLHGDLVAATAMNPLTVPAAVLLLGEVVYRALVLSRRIPGARWSRFRRVDLWGHVAVVVIYFGYTVAFYALR